MYIFQACNHDSFLQFPELDNISTTGSIITVIQSLEVTTDQILGVTKLDTPNKLIIDMNEKPYTKGSEISDSNIITQNMERTSSVVSNEVNNDMKHVPYTHCEKLNSECDGYIQNDNTFMIGHSSSKRINEDYEVNNNNFLGHIVLDPVCDGYIQDDSSTCSSNHNPIFSCKNSNGYIYEHFSTPCTR